MKLPVRFFAVAILLAAAACNAPTPTSPAGVTAGAPSMDNAPTPPSTTNTTTQTDTTPARGPNLFGSGN
jgi:hypothetical protein